MLGQRAHSLPLPSSRASSSTPTLESAHATQGTTTTTTSSSSSSPRRRTSATDEAQACYNLILILHHDTQHLIALRNGSLAALATVRPLLAAADAAIVPATRSVAGLGPFLERCRWPDSPTTSRKRRWSVTRSWLLGRRRRKSTGARWEEEEEEEGEEEESSGTGFEPEELFSWTLALTAQHAAVLSATDRVERFLVEGRVDVSEEERGRVEGGEAWWEQRRGEFENVGLIQSLLRGPRRGTAGATGGADEHKRAAAISEQDDAKSDSVSEPSIVSTPQWTKDGLSARPRIVSEDPSQQNEQPYMFARRVMTEPPIPTASDTGASAVLSRSETFGQNAPEASLARNASFCQRQRQRQRQRPRIATNLLPPLVGLPDSLALAHDTLSVPSPLKTQAPLSSDMIPGTTPLLSPLFTPGSDGPAQQTTPLTPLDLHMATLVAHNGLPSKTIQPVIRELDSMIVSPVESQDAPWTGVSPLDEEAEEPQSGKTRMPLVALGQAEERERVNDDRHQPYLSYMAQKQAVVTSRWSLRSKTSKT